MKRIETNNDYSVVPVGIVIGIRRALDGGRGKLRMDPNVLAERIGRLIDVELERLEMERKRHKIKKSVEAAFRFGKR